MKMCEGHLAEKKNNLKNDHQRVFSNKISACMQLLAIVWCIFSSTIEMINKKMQWISCQSQVFPTENVVQFSGSCFTDETFLSKWWFCTNIFAGVFIFGKHFQRCNDCKQNIAKIQEQYFLSRPQLTSLYCWTCCFAI